LKEDVEDEIGIGENNSELNFESKYKFKIGNDKVIVGVV
jgi:hypothetical protein